MKFKLNPLTGEFDYTSESANKQKLNPLTGEFNLVEGDGPFSQIFNPLNGKFNLGTRGGGGIIAEVTGNGYINLTNAVANRLMELKVYGGTEQDLTPTPDTPVDIVCNNGALRFSKNMANVNTQTALVGYYISTSGQVLESPYNRIYQEFIPCKPSTKYTLSISSAVYYVTISEYVSASDSGFYRRNAGSTGGNTKLTITTGANTTYLRFGANLSSSNITIDDVLAIDWQLEQGATPTPYHEYVAGGIYTGGTTETIEDELSNTATAEMLLKIGDYVDEQEILSGDITRNVGIKVLDGTEEIYYISSNIIRVVLPGGLPQDSLDGLCTHYKFFKGSSTPAGDKNFAIYKATYGGEARCVMGLRDSSMTSVADFKTFVETQYNAGTPVIVVYPLATPTTESVAGQTMNIPAGNSTIEITQASIDNLPLYAKYLQSN